MRELVHVVTAVILQQLSIHFMNGTVNTEVRNINGKSQVRRAKVDKNHVLIRPWEKKRWMIITRFPGRLTCDGTRTAMLV